MRINFCLGSIGDGLPNLSFPSEVSSIVACVIEKHNDEDAQIVPSQN